MSVSRAALDRILRVRRQTLELAQRSLAFCLEAETSAAEDRRRAEDAIRREYAAATALAAEDSAVEAFARWLPNGVRVRERADAALVAAQAATAEARVQVTAARAAVEAVTTLIDKRLAEEREEAERKAQANLDELALRRRVARLPRSG